MKVKPFFILLKTELLAWFRIPLNLFWIFAWPLLWMCMMGLVIPNASKGNPADFILFFFPSCMALVLFSTMISLALRLTLKKEMRILQRLKLLPFSPGFYFTVQFLSSVIIALNGLVCVVALGFFLGMTVEGSAILELLVIFCIASFTFSSIAFLIAGLVRKSSSANIIAMLVMFIMMFFSDMFIPLSDIQSVVYQLSRILPATSFLEIARGILIRGNSIFEFPAQLAIVFGWGAVCLAVSLKTFNFDVK